MLVYHIQHGCVVFCSAFFELITKVPACFTEVHRHLLGNIFDLRVPFGKSEALLHHLLVNNALPIIQLGWLVTIQCILVLVLFIIITPPLLCT